jgi:putative DNA primase/helicase
VFLGDQEIIAYMQRALGYSITADTREQKLFICWGKGANGKTTLFETVRAVVGTDYARTIPTRVLLHDPHAHDAETTKVVLYGLRLALFSETAEGGRLNEALVKLVTGGDTISARYLYHHPFNFTPVAKLWLFTNHKPRITDDSFAMWRRVVLVPFRAVFTTDQTIDPEVRRDPVQNMKELLLQEREAILAELVRGAVTWYCSRLDEPETVRAAVEEYRRESDPVREWMEAETEQDSEAKTPVAKLYERFQQWCEANGEKAMNIRSFGRRLSEMGFESCRVYEQRRYVKGYKGIRLQDTNTWEAE